MSEKHLLHSGPFAASLRGLAFALGLSCLGISPAGAAENYLVGTLRETPQGLAVGGYKLVPPDQAEREALKRCAGPGLCELRVSGPPAGGSMKVLSFEVAKRFSAPRDVMDYVYRRVSTWNAVPFHLEDRDLDRVLTGELAALAVRTNRKAEQEQEESLAQSPWLTAQEWDVRAVRIDVDDLGNGAALGMVRYRNFAAEDPELQTLTYDLRETPDGWRIADIVFSDAVRGSNRFSEQMKAYLAEAPTRPSGWAARSAESSRKAADPVDQIFGPGPARNGPSRPPPAMTMPALPDTPARATGPELPPNSQQGGTSRAAPAPTGAKFRPLVLTRPIVTRGRCHMGECSWARWLGIEKSSMANGEMSIKATVMAFS